MRRIIGIGFTIPSTDEDDYISIDSLSSLSDADIAIFSPDLTATEYSNYDPNSYPSDLMYEGKKLYNKESSAAIFDHLHHWKKEFLHFVESGGSLVVILKKKEDFYIYTGNKDISGTGRNQKVTNLVTSLSNYDFLPFSGIEFNTASGKTIVPNGPIMADLYKNFKDHFCFEVYLGGPPISNSTFTTKNRDRVLGSTLKIKNGYVIFVPYLNLNISDFSDYDEKTDDEYWNNKGIKAGKIFINNLVAIDTALRNIQEKTPKPDWTNSDKYKLTSSEKTFDLIQKNNKEIEKREKQNSNLQRVLEEQESLKDLLYETGKPLEKAVIKALNILGYKAENYDDGELELDQIITSPENNRFIGECEGKDNKDIDVSKFRQLLDALAADFEKQDVDEKAFGLLFGNPQRLLEPTERTLSFTKKCQTGAAREKIGLIKTEDLFKVARYTLETDDKAFAKKCRIAIKEQLGQIIKFPEIK